MTVKHDTITDEGVFSYKTHTFSSLTCSVPVFMFNEHHRSAVCESVYGSKWRLGADGGMFCTDVLAAGLRNVSLSTLVMCHQILGVPSSRIKQNKAVLKLGKTSLKNKIKKAIQISIIIRPNQIKLAESLLFAP